MATHWNTRPPDDSSGTRLYRELEIDNWRSIFNKYDELRCGEITVWALKQLLVDPDFRQIADDHVITVLEMKCASSRYTYVTYQEFVNIMCNRRTSSFRLAVEGEVPLALVPVEQYPSSPGYTSATSESTFFSAMVRKVAREFLTDELDRHYFADNYTCRPPPLFMPIVSFIEIGVYVYHSLDGGGITPHGPVPAHSVFIYRPDRRMEIWRFVLYMCVHAGWLHLLFNVLVQIIVGIPLEMVHGSCRIAIVYFAGILLGSLGTSVFDRTAMLAGASAGVYSLLAAHLANILLNFNHMELVFVKLAAISVIALADFGFAVWDRYERQWDTADGRVGYTAHVMGALAGLTIGLVVVRNYEQKLHYHYLWWLALSIYLTFVVSAMLANIFYY